MSYQYKRYRKLRKKRKEGYLPPVPKRALYDRPHMVNDGIRYPLGWPARTFYARGRLMKLRKVRPRIAIKRGLKFLRRPRPYFNQAEQLYIEAVTNPFGHNKYRTYNPPVGAKVMDTASLYTVAYTLTVTAKIIIGTSEVVCKMDSVKDKSLALGPQVYYSVLGNDRPTGPYATYTCPQWTRERGQLSHARIVGAALKVIPLSSPEDTAGHIRAGLTWINPQSAAGTYRTYAEMETHLDDNFYTLQEGVTVRWVPQQNSDFEFKTLETGGAQWTLGEGFMPFVRISGGKANTVVQFAAVYHIEAISLVNDTSTASPSPVSLQWQTLTAIVSDPTLAPVVARGNSFTSFFRGVGRVIGKVANWIDTHIAPIQQVAKGVGMLLA